MEKSISQQPQRKQHKSVNNNDKHDNDVSATNRNHCWIEQKQQELSPLDSNTENVNGDDKEQSQLMTITTTTTTTTTTALILDFTTPSQLTTTTMQTMQTNNTNKQCKQTAQMTTTTAKTKITRF